jgi:hypothetical protein
MINSGQGEVLGAQPRDGPGGLELTGNMGTEGAHL